MSTLYSLFANSVNNYPQSPALFVSNRMYSYSELSAISNNVANIFLNEENAIIGLLAHRSITAFSGVLGILKSGHTYLPLNPKFPAKRLADIIEASGCKTILVGPECEVVIPVIQKFLKNNISFIPFDSIPSNLVNDECLPVKMNTNAYLLFTSGSTGKPKGVPVKHSSVIDYVQSIQSMFQPNNSDKFSQTFDLSFDLSVHDMFVCWATGASLYCIPEKSVFAPSKFIREHELTWWFSVPSTIRFMDNFKMLKAKAFPTLKMSMFCGEALPVNLLEKWRIAANNSTLVNIYGPTEATIGITSYTLPNETSKVKHWNGIVSIGKAFIGQKTKIESNKAESEPGELLLSGSQLSNGYWNDEIKTSEVFYTDKNKVRWYKTGDAVICDSENDIFYVGRIDFQAKINGYRVELEEINHAINVVSGLSAYSVAWPIKDGIAESIYTFVTGGKNIDFISLKNSLKTMLPDYMQPKDVIFVEQFPLNANGKISKLDLIALLKS